MIERATTEELFEALTQRPLEEAFHLNYSGSRSIALRVTPGGVLSLRTLSPASEPYIHFVRLEGSVVLVSRTLLGRYEIKHDFLSFLVGADPSPPVVSSTYSPSDFQSRHLVSIHHSNLPVGLRNTQAALDFSHEAGQLVIVEDSTQTGSMVSLSRIRSEDGSSCLMDALMKAPILS